MTWDSHLLRKQLTSKLCSNINKTRLAESVFQRATKTHWRSRPILITLVPCRIHTLCRKIERSGKWFWPFSRCVPTNLNELNSLKKLLLICRSEDNRMANHPVNRILSKYLLGIGFVLLQALIATSCLTSLLAQDTLRVATYNLLFFPGMDSDQRIPHFRTVINAIRPDVLVVQELLLVYAWRNLDINNQMLVWL